jgi:hypothetical protein
MQNWKNKPKELSDLTKFLYVCGNCWGMPADQFARRWACMVCWSTRKRATPIVDVLWAQKELFYDIEMYLWDKLRDVVKTVGAEWIILKNKWWTVWGMSWAFWWVKNWTWETKINEWYCWAYNLQKAHIPIQIEIVRNMVIDLFALDSKRKNNPRVRSRVWTTSEEKEYNKNTVSKLFLFISIYWKNVEHMDSWERSDTDMDILQSLMFDHWIHTEDIRYIKENTTYDYTLIEKIIRFCELKWYKWLIRNRWTRGRIIFNLPSMPLCDD